MNSYKQLTLAAGLSAFAAASQAIVIDFAAMADGAWGESAWSPLTVTAGSVNVTITGGNSSQTTPAYAYLDANNAGLGVCSNLTAAGAAALNTQTGSSSNLCNPSSDDNVTFFESLTFSFDQDVYLDLFFNNNHDNGFNKEAGEVPGSDKINIDGADYGVSLVGLGNTQVGGTFMIAANTDFVVSFVNEQFYVGAIDVKGVAEPGTLALLGLGLLGLGAARRKA